MSERDQANRDDYVIQILDVEQGGPGIVVDGIPVPIHSHGDGYVLEVDAFAPPADLDELVRRYLVALKTDQYRR